MRKLLILSALPLALAGCVAPLSPQAVAPNPPAPAPAAPAPAPAAPAPSIVDTTARTAARNVVNREMAKRLPGVNTAPYTDCVINNASASEIAGIAARAGTDTGEAANTVAGIVQRPATTQCIAKVAAAAAPAGNAA